MKPKEHYVAIIQRIELLLVTFLILSQGATIMHHVLGSQG